MRPCECVCASAYVCVCVCDFVSSAFIVHPWVIRIRLGHQVKSIRLHSAAAESIDINI